MIPIRVLARDTLPRPAVPPLRLMLLSTICGEGESKVICGAGESKAAEKRLTAAAEKRLTAAATISAALAIDVHACAGCTRSLPTGAFSKTQLSKGASKRCKDCTASTATPSKAPAPPPAAPPPAAPPPAAALSSAAVPLPTCSKCRFKGVGHSDASGKFCCEWCWAGLEGRRWPTLGGHSPQFKALTAALRPSSFSEDDRENKVALVDVGMEADAECAELERTGALNGRLVLGFDTETKPSFKVRGRGRGGVRVGLGLA